MKFQLSFELETQEDRQQAHNLLNAAGMHNAIMTYYDEVLRPYGKYAELSDTAQQLFDEIVEKLNQHFKEFTDEN